MKLGMELRYDARDALSFSILERIDVGETAAADAFSLVAAPFSILERIDVGETIYHKEP